jgi:purine-nucleoside phosphorylase
MYKELTKKDWNKLLKFPEDKEVDAVIVSGNSLANREREIGFLEQALSNYKDVKKVEYIQDNFFSSIYEFEIGDKLIWFDVVYGGAYLSELLHVGCIFGSKKNFLVGTCGGLQKNLETGDLVIPTYTYGNESTTRIYQPDIKDHKHYADKELRKEFVKSISDYKIHSGPIITCQGMLGETPEDIKKWTEEGYLGVEMESSTFFAVSNSFNVPSVAVMHISDNLVKNILYGDEEMEKNREFRNKIRVYKYEKIMDNILTF